MPENNKLITGFFVGMLIIFGYLFRQLEKKIDLVWEDITIVGDALKAELDEIKEKIDDLEYKVQD